jgi:hypothetical protein
MERVKEPSRKNLSAVFFVVFFYPSLPVDLSRLEASHQESDRGNANFLQASSPVLRKDEGGGTEGPASQLHNRGI